MQITTQDLRILDFLALTEATTYDWLAAATRRSRGALRQRLPQLRRERLVARRLVSTGAGATAYWFLTDDGRRLIRNGENRLTPPDPWTIELLRATLRAHVILPRFTTHVHHGIYASSALTVKVNSLSASLAFNSHAVPPPRLSLAPLPDFIIEDSDLAAIDIDFGKKYAEVDWPDRLNTYELLGLRHLEVHTDKPPFADRLTQIGNNFPGVHLQVHLLPFSNTAGRS